LPLFCCFVFPDYLERGHPPSPIANVLCNNLLRCRWVLSNHFPIKWKCGRLCSLFTYNV